MNGMLSFALGLNAGAFTGALANAEGKLKGFIGSALKLPGVGTAIAGLLGSVGSTAAVVAGVMDAIDKGAELEHLSKRTGVAVEDLYRLEKGFKAAGLSAEDVSPALFLMQKALGGINEMGESTVDMFQRMGLDITALKSMKGPEQLKAVLGAINKLNQEGAAKAASTIFGRNQAGNMIQLARSTEEFSAGMNKSAEQAKIFARNAAAFEKVERSLGQLKSKTAGLFAGLAEGLAPALQTVLDFLNQIDLTKVGEQLGRIFTAFIQAFKEGKLVDLIVATFKMAFDAVVAIAPAAFLKLGVVLLRVFETPLEYLQAGIEYAVQQAMEQIGQIPIIGDKAGLSDFKADSWDEILKQRRETGAEYFMPGNNLQASEDAVNDFWESQKATLAEKWKDYAAVVDGFVSRAPKGSDEKKGPGGAKLDDAKESHIKGSDDALTKIGFVFGNRIGGTADIARDTADNTRRTADGVDLLVQHFQGGGNGSPLPDMNA
jgi:hypothetical protein